MWPLSILRRMVRPLHQDILKALYLAMIPVARCMLRSGIGFREFSKIGKIAFVKVATEDYGIRGRPTNISRVAVMTGLTRKEVKKLRNDVAENIEYLKFSSPPSEVLSYWHTAPEFLTHDAKPKILPFDGEGVSFSALVKLRAGDIPPGAMRTELLRVGAVEQNSEGMLEAKKRSFVPNGVDDRLVEGLYAMWGLADTVSFNSNPVAPLSSRYQQVAESYNIDPAVLPAFEQEARQKLQGYSDDFMNFLAENELSTAGSDRHGATVGAGFYFFRNK